MELSRWMVGVGDMPRVWKPCPVSGSQWAASWASPGNSSEMLKLGANPVLLSQDLHLTRLPDDLKRIKV